MNKKTTDIAKNLKRIGISAKQIMEATGLSQQELDQLF